MSRSEISTNDFAVSRMCRISSTGTPSRPSRCRCVKAIGGSAFQYDVVDAVHLDEPDLHRLLLRGRQVLADVVGADRQLAVSTIDHDRELDVLRPTEIHERI